MVLQTENHALREENRKLRAQLDAIRSTWQNPGGPIIAMPYSLATLPEPLFSARDGRDKLWPNLSTNKLTKTAHSAYNGTGIEDILDSLSLNAGEAPANSFRAYRFLILSFLTCWNITVDAKSFDLEGADGPANLHSSGTQSDDEDKATQIQRKNTELQKQFRTRKKEQEIALQTQKRGSTSAGPT